MGLVSRGDARSDLGRQDKEQHRAGYAQGPEAGQGSINIPSPLKGPGIAAAFRGLFLSDYWVCKNEF